MEVNGKEFKIKTDLKWKVYKKFEKMEQNIENVEWAIKKFTEPSLTTEDIDELTEDQVMGLILKFRELRKKKQISFKKKLGSF